MIKTLTEGLISHLAAGEVVERPSSIIRECIDNSIDARSTKISIETEESGVNSIVIDDDGKGIERGDLERIALAHSTSKISSLDDIYNIQTMGFRGEALFSMTSVGTLKIESNGNGIEIKDLKRSSIFKSTKEKGTRITLTSLFASLPARKAFLSTPQSENKRNLNLAEEKSLAFPEVEFSFKNNGKELLHYKSESQIERVSHFLNSDMDGRIKTVEKSEDDFSISLFYKENSIRKDKRKIKIYVNKRAVTDAHLMSAVLYAFSPFTPGGTFPECIVFIENDSSLTDFNVHPQKKECRLRNAKDIHHAISHIFKNSPSVFTIPDAIKNEPVDLNNIDINEKDAVDNKIDAIIQRNMPLQKTYMDFNKNDISEDFPLENNISITKSENYIKSTTGESKNFDLKKDITKTEITTYREANLLELENEIHFTYIGQIWNLFLLYTIDDTLYIMDQHAAAERVMFDKIKSGNSLQTLLFPLTIEVEKEVSLALEESLNVFKEKGVILNKKSEGEWELLAIPSVCKNNERDIIALIQSANTADLDEKLYAIIACHNSIRKGDFVSEKDAESLIEEVQKLSSPTCPHGRTFLTKIDKSALEALVMRE